MVTGEELITVFVESPLLFPVRYPSGVQITKRGCANPKPSFRSGQTGGQVATESVKSTSVFKTSKMAIGGNGANNVFLPLGP